MNSVWSVLKLTARATIWRTTPAPRLVGLPTLLICAIALAVFRIASQFLAAGPGGIFNPYGLNAVIAWLALDIAVAALFVPAAARATALSAMLALSILAEFIITAVQILAALVPAVAASSVWQAGETPIVIFAVMSLWWIGAMVAVLRSFAPWPRLAVLGRVVALWIALLAVSAILPHAPVFIGRDFDVGNANWW